MGAPDQVVPTVTYAYAAGGTVDDGGNTDPGRARHGHNPTYAGLNFVEQLAQAGQPLPTPTSAPTASGLPPTGGSRIPWSTIPCHPNP
jgi:hypothetical protein